MHHRLEYPASFVFICYLAVPAVIVMFTIFSVTKLLTLVTGFPQALGFAQVRYCDVFIVKVYSFMAKHSERRKPQL